MFNRLLNRFGPRFYTEPKEYSVGYEVTVKNISRSHQSANLMIPVVASTDYQTILEDVKLFTSEEISTEPYYKNKYIVHKIALDPNQSETFKQIFKIKVLPRTASKKSFSLGDYETLDDTVRKQFLKPNEYLASREPDFIELAQKIVGDEKNVRKILEKINEWVIKNLTYGDPIPGLYKATDVIKTKVTDCGGFDTVFITLCQALKIPARIVSGFWAGYHVNDMHAWVEILLPDGSWMPADPSVEHLTKHKKTRKSGKLGFTGSDRIALSVGCDFELEAGDERFDTDILQNPILFPENDKLEVTRIFSTQPL